MYFLLKVRRILNQVLQLKPAIAQLFALMFIIINSSVIAQWSTQSPIPTQLDIRGIGAVSPEKVFIATDDNSLDNSGALFESPDGGTNWVQRNIPISLGEPFYGLFFIDSLNGWAYGNDNYRTTDSGINWIQLPFLGSTYFMQFYSANFGLATGNFGLYISLDGGLSWNPSPNDIFAYDFVSDQIGLGVSSNGIYITTDSGLTFTLVKAGLAEAVKFLSPTLAVGIVDSIFVRSTDGGETFGSTGISAEGRNNFIRVSSDVVLAYGRSGSFPDYDDRIFRSSDGGQSWADLGEVMDPGSYATSFSFAVPNTQSVVATDGAGNMFHSSDAGLNWTQVFFAPGGMQPGFLSSAVPVFADAQTGYFGYGNGLIIKTTDAGASWFQISSGSGNNLNDVDRFANGDLIAIGENGTILRKQSSSALWALQPAVSQNHLKAVQVLNSSDVFIVDDAATIYKSTDGGLNWTAASNSPTTLSSVEDMHFNSLQDGWILGYGFIDGSLFQTTNGGSSWNPIPNILGGYVALDVEGSNIWAANVTGLYFRSTDNGTTWIDGNLPNFPFNIQDMDFFDSNTGYAVGWGGQAFRSSDGGVT